MKPVTWFAPAWAFLCGSIASGEAALTWSYVGRTALGMLLTGPIVCGLSQVINDYFDRDVDAINEPQRLIPSGLVSHRQVFITIAVLVLIAFTIALFFGAPVTLLTAIGMILAVAYSAHPLRAKRNGWAGNTIVGISYEGLPWLAGHLSVAALSPRSMVLAALFSFGTIGIMAINDFKSMEGDRQMGIKTLPVLYGAWGAAWLIVLIMALAQLWVMMFFLVWGQYLIAAIVFGSIVLQIPLQRTFLANPITNAVKYSASSSGLFVLNMLVAAIGASAL
jgi:chlorophyll synthase